MFGIEVSKHVLVDIKISENTNDNQVTIVGCPTVLGSTKKQMRHVTPYAFIKNAIVSKIEVEQKDNTKVLLNIIPDFIQRIIPSLVTIKEGICLSEGDFEYYIKHNKQSILKKYKGLTAIDLYETKLETSNPDALNTKNVYYLVSNHYVIESWEKYKNPNDEEIKDAQDNYHAKWQKYIKFAMQYLNEGIQDNEYAIISSAELIARLILTIFNQSKYACFAEEGNTLPEEIRVYKDAKDAKNRKDNYKIYSHAEICEKYEEIAKRGTIVRIVNNEGYIVTRTSDALDLINSILSSIGYEDSKLQQFIKKYNSTYDFKITIPELHQYNEQLSIGNFKEMYSFHVAKHLYAVFDFKPLEKEVLVPAERNANQVQIDLYSSATENKPLCYSKQDGGKYREQCYNSRKGYNKYALFRNLLTDDETKDLLIEKTISHFFISLIPFVFLIAPDCDKEQSRESLRNTFNVFMH